MDLFQAIETPAFTEFVTYSQDGSLLADCHYDEVVIWNVEQAPFQKVASLEHEGATWKCCFTPNGDTLCSACSDGNIYIWDTETWQLKHQIQASKGCLYGVDIHPSGSAVATCGSDGIIRLYSLHNYIELCKLSGHVNSVEDITFSPCGKKLASASKDYTLRLWFNIDEVISGEKSTAGHLILGWHNGWVLSVSFSPDGKMLASTSMDKTARLWSVEKMFLLKTLRAHTNIVWRACWVKTSSGRLLLVTVSSDRVIRIWNAENGQSLTLLKNLGDKNEGDAQLLCCSTSPIRPLVAVGTYHAQMYFVSLDYIILEALCNSKRTSTPTINSKRKPIKCPTIKEVESEKELIITNRSNNSNKRYGSPLLGCSPVDNGLPSSRPSIAEMYHRWMKYHDVNA